MDPQDSIMVILNIIEEIEEDYIVRVFYEEQLNELKIAVNALKDFVIGNRSVPEMPICF